MWPCMQFIPLQLQSGSTLSWPGSYQDTYSSVSPEPELQSWILPVLDEIAVGLGSSPAEIWARPMLPTQGPIHWPDGSPPRYVEKATFICVSSNRLHCLRAQLWTSGFSLILVSSFKWTQRQVIQNQPIRGTKKKKNNEIQWRKSMWIMGQYQVN